MQSQGFKAFLLSLPPLVLLQACGTSDKKTQSVHREVFGTAQTYQLQNPDCQGTSGPLEAQPVYLWQGESADPFVRDLSGLSADGGLHGDLVDSVLYGAKERATETCLVSNDSANCSSNEEVLAEPKPLPFCKSSTAYAPDSVEGIALSSLYNIESAYRFYKTINGSLESLRPAKLLLLPELMQVAEVRLSGKVDDEVKSAMEQELGFPIPLRIEQAMVDNAGFGQTEDGSPFFVIFPESKEYSRKLFGGMHLWNSSFVLSHELGHHIFLSHGPEWLGRVLDGGSAHIRKQTRLNFEPILNDSRTLPSDPHLADESKRPESPFQSQPDDSRIARRFHFSAVNDPLTAENSGRIMAALNEGFADLFAFYSLGGRSGYTANMGCFAQSRDVTEDRFAGGMNKRFDLNVMLALSQDIEDQSGVRPPPASADLCRPDLADEHTVGAIFAHLIDGVLSVRAQSSASEPRPEFKASLLLMWLERFFDEVSKDSRPDLKSYSSFTANEFVLLKIMESLYRSAQTQPAVDQKAIKSHILKTVPAAEDICKNRSTQCERFTVMKKDQP